MFAADIYQNRRLKLVQQVKSGLILLLGNVDSPFNSVGNCYRFRQDSSFLYFCGLDQPGLAVVLDVDSGSEILFGPTQSLDDVIWSGTSSTLQDQAEKVGVSFRPLPVVSFIPAVPLRPHSVRSKFLKLKSLMAV